MDDVADLMETLHSIDRFGAKHLTSGNENTRLLGDGLWEIKKSRNRIYYCYCENNCVYMLHACNKQKGKAELSDIAIGKRRMNQIRFKNRGDE